MVGRETSPPFLFMNKYLALIFLIVLALIPPIDFVITNPTDDLWFVMILVAGFFGVFTLFMKTDWVIPVVSIGSFALCFFSAAPYLSFTSYVSIIICCYLYIICRRVEDWSFIFRALQSLLFINVLLVVMQSCGKDSLLNFGLGKEIVCFGVVGQHMQMGSFSVVLSAFLMSFSFANIVFPFIISFFCSSPWTFLCAATGFFSHFRRTKAMIIFFSICLVLFIGFSIHQEKFSQNLTHTGRVHVWKKTAQLALQHPLVGWGPGSYKSIFGGLDDMPEHNIPYKNAHNAFLQLLFETGIPFTLFTYGALGILFYRLWKARETACVTGLIMVFMDTLVHFPDRMMQTVGLIICFLAYCMCRLDKKFVFGVVQKT